MYHDLGRLFLTALFALVLSACKSVTVVNPVAGQVYTSAPAIELGFPQGAPPALVVKLNDQDISSLFTISETGATAAGTGVRPFLADGQNILRVSTPATLPVKFIYDVTGPMIHISRVTEGSQLNIQGYADDPSGVRSVTVNGTAVTLNADNTFNFNVANGNYVTFVSTDQNSRVRTQKFARPNVAAANSVSLRINRRGMDFITREAESIMESSALGSLIAGQNPMKRECLLGNCYEINVNDARLRTVDLQLNILSTGNGSLGITGNMTGIWTSYSILIDPLIGFNSTINGEATASRADFTASARVSVGTGNAVNVAISNLSLNLGTLSANVGILPSWLVSPFLNAFKVIVEWILAEQIKQILPAKVASMVDTYPQNLFIEINGDRIKPDILPSTITSPNNGLSLGLGARLYNVTTRGPRVLGSAWKDMGNAPAATNSSPSGVERDVGVVVSSNVINQALSAATASGMLNFTLTDEQIPVLRDLVDGLDETEQVRLRTIPLAPPTLELIRAENGLATFRLHDFYIGLDAVVDDSGQLKLAMGATVDVESTADLGVTNGNAVAVELIGTPRIKIRKLDENGTLQLAEPLAQALLDDLMPRVLPVVMRAVGAFPLPSFEGYSLSVGDIWVLDTSANFIGIVANMVKTTTTANSPAPTTYAEVAAAMQASALNVAQKSVVPGSAPGAVTINVDGYNPSEGELSYRYSLNGEPFSLWKQRKNIQLHGLKPGQHEIKVCARTELLVEDPSCTVVNFEVKR